MSAKKPKHKILKYNNNYYLLKLDNDGIYRIISKSTSKKYIADLMNDNKKIENDKSILPEYIYF